jgi:hypothetical protein
VGFTAGSREVPGRKPVTRDNDNNNNNNNNKHISIPNIGKEQYIKRHDTVCAEQHFHMQGNRDTIRQRTLV